jgi:hypothetical protein
MKSFSEALTSQAFGDEIDLGVTGFKKPRLNKKLNVVCPIHAVVPRPGQSNLAGQSL